MMTRRRCCCAGGGVPTVTCPGELCVRQAQDYTITVRDATTLVVKYSGPMIYHATPVAHLACVGGSPSTRSYRWTASGVVDGHGYLWGWDCVGLHAANSPFNSTIPGPTKVMCDVSYSGGFDTCTPAHASYLNYDPASGTQYQCNACGADYFEPRRYEVFIDL